MHFLFPHLIAVQRGAVGFDMIDMTWLTALFIGAGCFAWLPNWGPPFLLLSPFPSIQSYSSYYDDDARREESGHATLGLYKKILNRAPKSLGRWEMCGQVKVVVKVESEDDMLFLQERANSLNLPTHITIDAGRTQIAPRPADLVDDVTGGLKLL
ncbi:UNVERIFIED_CONTAM: Peptidyl-tRNA hydrolase [Sesamum calycinum]|uniref:peptidyl-tRNA hydrolase n=1 Tax=Sesamum calycinum TaxID=2727403 RepID=A0AAW2L6U9_9LAMI